MTPEDKSIVDQLSPAEKVALTLFGEIRNGSEQAIIGVGNAILNRVRTRKPIWGMTPEQVVMAPHQFSCWNDDPTTPNDEAVMAEAQRLLDKAPLGPKMRLCLAVAEAVINGRLMDNTKGATHYYSPNAMRPLGRKPLWAIGLKPTVSIGGHLFFAGVR